MKHFFSPDGTNSSNNEPSPPRAKHVECTKESLIVFLRDGRTISVPTKWFSRLHKAKPEQLKSWRFVGRGIGIHWEELDEDIAVWALMTPEDMDQSGK